MRLTVEKLRVQYGKIVAIPELTASFGPGVTAVIGPNGAGKSTLLAAIAGLHAASAGTTALDGRALPRGRADIAVERGIALVPEGRRVFADLTVHENLLLGGYRRRPRVSEADVQEVVARFPELARLLAVTAGSLSGGEQQMVAIARALMSRPRVLMLDEPSLGLAPKRVREIFDDIAALASEDVSVILVEQNVRAAARIADRVVQITRGRIQRTGTGEEFLGIATLEEFTEGSV